MKLNYSTEHLRTVDETTLALHWVHMSATAHVGYLRAVQGGTVAEYLEQLQRERSDIDMPRFTVARVDLKRLEQYEDPSVAPEIVEGMQRRLAESARTEDAPRSYERDWLDDSVHVVRKSKPQA